MKKNKLNRTVKKYKSGYELDRLLDQDNWNGRGSRIYHIYYKNKYIVEVYSIPEADRFVKHATKKRYGVDFTIGYWYAYDKKTDMQVGYNFKTRQKARNYAKKRNEKNVS